jgi:hypothetical protein
MIRASAEDHQWNEIRINDGWIQVDPTIYYHYYTHPETYPTYQDLWFDNPQAYSNIGWYEGGYSSVSVLGTNEDLSTKYCNTSKLSILCQGCDHVKVMPIGRGISIDQDIREEASYNLGKMNYFIFADKTIIPYLLVNEKNATISLYEDKKINISSYPEEIKLTNFALLLLGTTIVVGVILAVIFSVLMGINFLIKWKRERMDKKLDLGEEKKL